jgi:Response regulator containing a CheY-like receiver domain and an HTH DNA-binding domain
MGIFAGMTGLFLNLLMSKKKALHHEAHSTLHRKFMISTFLIGLISFFTFYSQYIIFIQPANTAIRLLDYLFWACFIIYWIDYLDSMVEDPFLHKFKTILHYGCLCYIVIWLFATSYIWDVNFHIVSRSGRILFILLDLLFCLLSVSVVAVYAIRGQIKMKDRLFSFYIFSVSTVLVIYAGWEFANYIRLFAGISIPQVSVLHPFNATAFFLFFTNVFTLVYVYRKDFSESYFAENSVQVVSESFETRKDPNALSEDIAVEHNLTPREKEVMDFVFKGFNNAEIADELFISQNTVKHHIYNLFKKLNVSNRVELICLLQEYYT